MKDQVEQLNKIGVTARSIGVEEEAVKNQKEPDCVYIRIVTSVHLSFCFRYYDLSSRGV